MHTVSLYNRHGQRLLTLKEAEEKGYGSAYNLKKRLNRGLLRGYKIGPLWLLLEAFLVHLHLRKRRRKSRLR